jgi:hypothetical protein
LPQIAAKTLYGALNVRQIAAKTHKAQLYAIENSSILPQLILECAANYRKKQVFAGDIPPVYRLESGILAAYV